MPLDDNLRLQILCINCTTQRLRRELDIVRKVILKDEVLFCRDMDSEPLMNIVVR